MNKFKILDLNEAEGHSSQPQDRNQNEGQPNNGYPNDGQLNYGGPNGQGAQGQPGDGRLNQHRQPESYQESYELPFNHFKSQLNHETIKLNYEENQLSDEKVYPNDYMISMKPHQQPTHKPSMKPQTTINPSPNSLLKEHNIDIESIKQLIEHATSSGAKLLNLPVDQIKRPIHVQVGSDTFLKITTGLKGKLIKSIPRHDERTSSSSLLQTKVLKPQDTIMKIQVKKEGLTNTTSTTTTTTTTTATATPATATATPSSTRKSKSLKDNQKGNKKEDEEKQKFEFKEQKFLNYKDKVIKLSKLNNNFSCKNRKDGYYGDVTSNCEVRNTLMINVFIMFNND